MNKILSVHPAMQAFLDAGNTKPVVNYRPHPMQYIPEAPGKGAIVWPTNHQNHLKGHQNVSNTTYCYTSQVIRVGDNGEFETLNTIYKPIDNETKIS